MDFVRVFFFDFGKAFDSVPHAIVCNKLMPRNVNPYVIKWIVGFRSNRKQRVVVDGFLTEFGPILYIGWLKLLGIIFQENPLDWDLHVDNLLRKARSRLYILRVCKYFEYPKVIRL